MVSTMSRINERMPSSTWSTGVVGVSNTGSGYKTIGRTAMEWRLSRIGLDGSTPIRKPSNHRRRSFPPARRSASPPQRTLEISVEDNRGRCLASDLAIAAHGPYTALENPAVGVWDTAAQGRSTLARLVHTGGT